MGHSRWGVKASFFFQSRNIPNLKDPLAAPTTNGWEHEPISWIRVEWECWVLLKMMLGGREIEEQWSSDSLICFMVWGSYSVVLRTNCGARDYKWVGHMHYGNPCPLTCCLQVTLLWQPQTRTTSNSQEICSPRALLPPWPQQPSISRCGSTSTILLHPCSPITPPSRSIRWVPTGGRVSPAYSICRRSQGVGPALWVTEHFKQTQDPFLCCDTIILTLETCMQPCICRLCLILQAVSSRSAHAMCSKAASLVGTGSMFGVPE